MVLCSFWSWILEFFTWQVFVSGFAWSSQRVQLLRSAKDCSHQKSLLFSWFCFPFVWLIEMWRDPGVSADSFYEIRPECTDVPVTRFKIKVIFFPFFWFNMYFFFNFNMGVFVHWCIRSIWLMKIGVGLLWAMHVSLRFCECFWWFKNVRYIHTQLVK